MVGTKNARIFEKSKIVPLSPQQKIYEKIAELSGNFSFYTLVVHWVCRGMDYTEEKKLWYTLCYGTILTTTTDRNHEEGGLAS